jgi:hypothetical protein
MMRIVCLSAIIKRQAYHQTRLSMRKSCVSRIGSTTAAAHKYDSGDMK